jgi:hypothetical protein
LRQDAESDEPLDDKLSYAEDQSDMELGQASTQTPGGHQNFPGPDDEAMCDEHKVYSNTGRESPPSQESYRNISVWGQAMYDEHELTPEVGRESVSARGTYRSLSVCDDEAIDDEHGEIHHENKATDDGHEAMDYEDEVVYAEDVPMGSASNNEGKPGVELTWPFCCWTLTECRSDQGCVTQSPLDKLDLKVDPGLKILICLTCRHALDPTPKAVIKHFDEKHRSRGKKLDKLYPGLSARLTKALECIDFAPPIKVRSPLHDQAPISGIQVSRGFYCPLTGMGRKPCLYISGAISTMHTHIKSKHQGDIPRPSVKDLEGCPCDYQTLFKGPLKKYFRVRTGLTGLEAHPDGSRNPYSVFMRQPNTASPDIRPEPIKDDELPSLLRATRWNVFLEPYRKRPSDVVALVQFPTARVYRMTGSEVEKALSRLPDVTEVWMDTTYKHWKDSTRYIHRILARYPM